MSGRQQKQSARRHVSLRMSAHWCTMLHALAKFYNLSEAATVELLIRVTAKELDLHTPQGRAHMGRVRIADCLAHPERGLEEDVVLMQASRKNARVILG
jgi:hypothetical protein